MSTPLLLPPPPPRPPDPSATSLCVCDHTCKPVHPGGQWVPPGTKRTHEGKASLYQIGYLGRGRGASSAATAARGKAGRGRVVNSQLGLASATRGMPRSRRGTIPHAVVNTSKRPRSPSPPATSTARLRTQSTSHLTPSSSPRPGPAPPSAEETRHLDGLDLNHAFEVSRSSSCATLTVAYDSVCVAAARI